MSRPDIDEACRFATIECPECEADLAVKRGRSFPADTDLSVVHLQGLRAGACPNCGGRISEHVAGVRRREHRIEQVVAIVGTALVLGLYLATSAASLLEGVAAYARGVVPYFLAQRTFLVFACNSRGLL